MNKHMRKIRESYEKIILDLTMATLKKDIVCNEIKLFAMVIGSIMLFASLANLLLGIYWSIPLLKMIVTSVMILSTALIIIHVANRNHLSNRSKLNIISIMLVAAIFSVYFSYYEIIGVMFWFIMVMITMFVILSSSRVLYVYQIVLYLAIFIITLLTKGSKTVEMNHVNNILLFVMLFLILLISYIGNRLYRRIMDEKVRKFRNVYEKNEEITALYEEITASDEELKEQNEKLKLYNDEIAASKERLEFLAYNDTLTGLPNRKMLIEQLDYLIASEMEHHHSFAVVFIDLDNFKKINDSMGHAAGDGLLIQVAERLHSQMHKNDMLGRLGGDELALIIRRSLSGEALLAYVQVLCDLFDESYVLGDICTKVTASFGIALYPEDAESADDLLKAADTAMYKAKELGKNNVQFYHKDMKNEIIARMNMENQLLQALRNNEFYLEYQPLFDTVTKKVLEFEALIRWKTADNKIIRPVDFIPFAEEIGLINEIGDWVLKKVCDKIKELEQYGFKEIKIAVNISAIQMEQESFLEDVKAIISESKVDPEALEFEITESVFLHDKQKAMNKIIELKKLGIKISMDDFGTGYSSLSYLLELPIDKLKIDRSFIRVIENENSKKDIIGSIINMVHSLDMKVVAEGIESKTQLEYLERESCDLLQGFLLSLPLGDDEMHNVLSR